MDLQTDVRDVVLWDFPRGIIEGITQHLEAGVSYTTLKQCAINVALRDTYVCVRLVNSELCSEGMFHRFDYMRTAHQMCFLTALQKRHMDPFVKSFDSLKHQPRVTEWLLLLLLSSSSLLSPLCGVFTIIYRKRTIFLGYLVLQLFCIYSLCYM
jgi:hypothetical protein